MDFDRSPLLIIWETTRACALACRHCRAEAEMRRDPGELNTEEGLRTVDEAAALAKIMVFSGGDALNRDDLEIFVRRAKMRGLHTGAIPAATPGLTRARLESLKDSGLDQLALSLDAPNAELHDSFRGVPGAFARTIAAAAEVRKAGLPLQINTCFGAWNLPRLEEMITLVQDMGAVFWEIFLLVPMGRGRGLTGLSARRCEKLFERVYELNQGGASRSGGAFVAKITEAPHYARFVLQRRLGEVRHFRVGVQGCRISSRQAVNAGKGFLFVDHVGNIYPSGFLPVVAGNVRRDSLAEVYRNSPIFRELRNPLLLKGKCGRCEFASLCGGSRARAYALTGDYLASDPWCAFKPAVN
ncbi:MAG: radical SAM protein [Elusimicrobia bacterium]|nr:radical SAM protein [Elusimicrobiota bacterium]